MNTQIFHFDEYDFKDHWRSLLCLKIHFCLISFFVWKFDLWLCMNSYIILNLRSYGQLFVLVFVLSAKIKKVQPKSRNNFGTLLNSLFLQYCYFNIGLFTMAPHIVNSLSNLFMAITIWEKMFFYSNKIIK